jgi:hypothetical protein
LAFLCSKLNKNIHKFDIIYLKMAMGDWEMFPSKVEKLRGMIALNILPVCKVGDISPL